MSDMCKLVLQSVGCDLLLILRPSPGLDQVAVLDKVEWWLLYSCQPKVHSWLTEEH